MENVLDDFQPVISQSEAARTTFIRKTYGHVALAVLGFIVVETIFMNIPGIENLAIAMMTGLGGYAWLLVLGGFMFATNMANKWAHSATDKNSQYLALGLYVVAEAFIFIPLIFMAIVYTGGAVLMQAGVLTLALFSGLTAIAVFSKKDFSFLRSGIMIGGAIAMGLIVAGMIFGFNLGLWFSVGMVGLAGASILYQTSGILNTYHTEQYVAASMGLFASLMLLFWYILDILMRMQD